MDRPRIHRDLVEAGVRCGKNRVARIMRKAGIRSRTKRKFKATTNSKHNLPVAPNLLNQDFTAEAADRAWVGDITYIWTDEGWLYLAVLLDLYNREVVGWSASSRMTRQLAIDALQMALGRRDPGQGCCTIRTAAASTRRPIIRKFSKSMAWSAA
jgi:putative transposase